MAWIPRFAFGFVLSDAGRTIFWSPARVRGSRRGLSAARGGARGNPSSSSSILAGETFRGSRQAGKERMRITWYGHAAFLIEAGGLRMILDPYRSPDSGGYEPIDEPADLV